MEFSIDYIFGAITFACVFFFFQMLVDFNNQRSQVAPKFQRIREIRSRHEDEIKKVAKLSEEAEQKVEVLDRELAELEVRQTELDSEITALEGAKKPY